MKGSLALVRCGGFAVAVAIVVGMVVVPPGVADDDDDSSAVFTEELLEGTWGFTLSGTILPPALPVATPAAAVGLISFDGQGGCSVTDQLNVGGVAIPSLTGFRTSTSCDVSVNPDGTGTLSVLFPGDPAPAPISFVIADDANEIRFIRADLGVASGVAKRQ